MEGIVTELSVKPPQAEAVAAQAVGRFFAFAVQTLLKFLTTYSGE